MNADRLFAHYGRIADAPDAVSRLRRFVLDLAARGKLVPQNPNDEPAIELLKRIAAQKSRLGLAVPPISIEPSDLPNGWALATIGSYSVEVFTGPFGSMLHQSDYVHGGVPLVNPSHMENDRIHPDPRVSVSASMARRMSSYALAPGDIVMARRGEVGRAALVEQSQSGWLCGTGSFFLRFIDDVNRHFLLLLLKTSSLRRYLAGKAVGTTMVNLNHNILKSAPLHIPPLAEQHRIVAKVDELMALCDRLEAVRATREATRDRLAAASLARLSTYDSDPTTFNDHAGFVLDTLSAITTCPDQIKQLRQAILNLAVRGKLVPQDANDVAAPDYGAGALAHLDPPFEIPTHWRWARLHTLGKLTGGGTPSKLRDDFWNGDIPWVSPKDMKVDYLTSAQLQISKAAIAGSAAHLIEAGSVLFVVRGMILAHSFPVAVARVSLAINQDMKALVLRQPAMAEYVLRALKGLKREMLKRVQRSTHGTCRLEASDYADFLIPIPPLAEQHRIVAKVDELMALCDRLEVSLATGDDTRCRLLDALLAEAVAPARSVASSESDRIAAYA